MGSRSDAVGKSSPSLLRKSLSVLGAEGSDEVRMRREWSLTVPANLMGWEDWSQYVCTHRRCRYCTYLGDPKKGDVRNRNQQLVVCIALQHGFGIEALSPSLLNDLVTGIELGLVESRDLLKLNLLVQQILQGRFDIVGMVMGAVVVASMTAVIIVTVGMGMRMRHDVVNFSRLEHRSCVPGHWVGERTSKYQNIESCRYLQRVYGQITRLHSLRCSGRRVNLAGRFDTISPLPEADLHMDIC